MGHYSDQREQYDEENYKLRLLREESEVHRAIDRKDFKKITDAAEVEGSTTATIKVVHLEALIRIALRDPKR